MKTLTKKEGIGMLMDHLLTRANSDLDEILTTKEMVAFLRERGLWEELLYVKNRLSGIWGNVWEETTHYRNSLMIERNKEYKETDEGDENDKKS